MNYKILGVVAIAIFALFALNQSGVITLLGSSTPSSPSPSPGVSPWCLGAQSTVPLSNPQPTNARLGCYIATFTTLKIVTQDAVTGAATNSLFIRVLSNGGSLNNAPAGTVLEVGQESSNVYTLGSNGQTYQTGQALQVEVCSGSNGASQSTNCTSDFVAGNTVTYYPFPSGNAQGAGAGYVPYANSNGQISLTLTLPVEIVQNKFDLCGQFSVNATTGCTGVGSGGSAGTAKEYQTTGASALGKFFTYTLTVQNTYSSTTFPYEAGFQSSILTDASNRQASMYLQCVEAKTGGVSGDAPIISGIPQLTTTGGGVSNGGTIVYAVQIPDTSTLKSALNSQSPVTSLGTFTTSLSIAQNGLASGDTFTLTCNVYMWYSSVWPAVNNAQVNPEAVAMTGTFTLTMTF